ncbi:efflux RND transporter periplasmic adaptor subunit [Roseovarius sp. EL26]|uniref:efflux RND transporter periplasmic adaptor subunit n=1 Tax=Roseovarius sp. EL26 TaxID=2126672 RepID=UPI000EA05F10|nr:efflux RND transporter periplasmic adaptor subunit [Roseovarius sp. EL26]
MRLISITSAAFLSLAAPLMAQDIVKPVKLMKIEDSDGSVTRQFFGRVVARETVDLAFQVSGQIVNFPVKEGEPVKQGELIAKLDLEPFEISLDQARVQKEQADRDLARYKLLEGNTVSQVSVDDAQTADDLAKISLRDAERNLNEATLLAPFDGLVAARSLANFSTINAGTPVVRLHDMSDLRIEIDVPEVLFQQAGKDPDFEIFARFPASDETFPVEVREFNAETSTIGQTFTITFGMEPPEHLVILPGSSATVIAIQSGQTEHFIVPTAAIVTANDGSTSVMVFEPTGEGQGTVSSHAVEITPSNKGEVQVISGLNPGDEIAAAGASELSDGQTVRRFTGFAN